MSELNTKHYLKTMRHYGLHLQPGPNRHSKERVYVKDGVSWQIAATLYCVRDKAESFSVCVKKKEGSQPDALEEKYYFKIARFVREELLASVGAEHDERRR